MKKVAITFLALMGVTGSFFLWRHFVTAKDSGMAVASVEEHSPHLLEEGGYYGKAVVLLIDGTEIYCGKDELPQEAMEDYVLKTMDLNKVKQVAIVTSISARYGDVVALMDRLRKRGIRVMTVATKPVSIGTRLPAVD